ncbi:hypothetical protein N473_08740 [Pseudoalteromonas luteoviolacea CPMOR-1]|uniref:DUF2846 domain-containing protein n=1 Tax=Pseudoalteromonas luteoviolacea CPMOR-1 TaxID=1365248 RepID=A0A161YV10_9GAMM|nr:hypothetical protein [Pseudoalteromonas luteoviolacea]KZN66468.1 hypothetical protein N473_08740 [Pseudoalteromonas luteoviolacea CPMOR-1]
MKIKMLFLLASLFLTGCESGPTELEIEQAVNNFELKPVSEGKARVYIYYRMSSHQLGDIAFSLSPDGDFVGKVFYDEHTTFEVPAGENTIYYRGFGKSNKGVHLDSEKFTFDAGKTYILNVVHGSIFNQYADDGQSLISSLNLRKNQNAAIYYLAKTEEASSSETCLSEKSVSLFKVVYCGQ